MASALKPVPLEYTSLDKVCINQVCNVYGVVKFVKVPGTSSTGELYQQISITDQSISGDRLVCMIFSKDGKLPLPEIGDIVRFHRLRIVQYNEKPQGRGGSRGFSWALFDNRLGSGYEAKKSSSLNYSPADQQIINQLRTWTETIPFSQAEINSRKDHNFASVSINDYFDIVVQVVSKCLLSPTAVLLRVWDGSTVNGPVVKVPVPFDASVEESVALAAITKNYLYDVAIFDDHAAEAAKVKPGDIIHLRNLHAMMSKNITIDGLKPIEFCLHRGFAYNRGLNVLLNDCEAARQLKKVLQEIEKRHEAEIAMNIEELINDEIQDSNTSVFVRVLESKHSSQRSGSSDAKCNSNNVSDSDPVCMETNASYILTQHNMTRSKLGAVRNMEVPKISRIRAQVKDFFPRYMDLEDFLHVHCPKCNFLSSMRKGRMDQLGITADEEYLYSCPNCLQTSQRVSVPVPKLQIIFAIQLLLVDSTGWLIAGLWRDEAENFFNCSPEALLKSSEKFQAIIHKLESLTNQKNKEGCWIECCLKSFSTGDGVCYQIFDTRLIIE